MHRHGNHAIVYQGPFDPNFKLQAKGRDAYVKSSARESPTPYHVPKETTGLRFGQMEKEGKHFVITRVQYGTTDVWLERPILGRGTGPSGAYLWNSEAAELLNTAIRENPTQSGELSVLLPVLDLPEAPPPVY